LGGDCQELKPNSDPLRATRFRTRLIKFGVGGVKSEVETLMKLQDEGFATKYGFLKAYERQVTFPHLGDWRYSYWRSF
jgi:hypothetical protein